MNDPLSEIISLLKPHAPFSKLVHASSPFHVRRENLSEAFYCTNLFGSACLEVDNKNPIYLNSGDFVLIPALNAFSFKSLDPLPTIEVSSNPILGSDGIYRVGDSGADSDVQIIVGHCRFASTDTNLLVSLMPDLVLVKDEPRLANLASLLKQEIASSRPAKDVVVEHLLQVLLIEAFRSNATPHSHAGILRGLADSRIGPTIRAIHSSPSRNWTILHLANIAQLSRSAFFARFSKIVGTAPMGYLLHWRMSIAKDLLTTGRQNISEVSEAIGYGSASAFSSAFSRHVGISPSAYSMLKSNRT